MPDNSPRATAPADYAHSPTATVIPLPELTVSAATLRAKARNFDSLADRWREKAPGLATRYEEDASQLRARAAWIASVARQQIKGSVA
jgi:hypothetical protein